MRFYIKINEQNNQIIFKLIRELLKFYTDTQTL